jgi:hypothetical protein
VQVIAQREFVSTWQTNRLPLAFPNLAPSRKQGRRLARGESRDRTFLKASNAESHYSRGISQHPGLVAPHEKLVWVKNPSGSYKVVFYGNRGRLWFDTVALKKETKGKNYESWNNPYHSADSGIGRRVANVGLQRVLGVCTGGNRWPSASHYNHFGIIR